VTYAGKLSKIEIDPEFLKSEGLELALDGVVAAVNSGMEQADKAMEAEVDRSPAAQRSPA